MVLVISFFLVDLGRGRPYREALEAIMISGMDDEAIGLGLD